MLTNTTTATGAPNNVVRIADQMLDRYDAAAFIRETFGVPLEVADLERAAKAGTGSGIPALGTLAVALPQSGPH